MKKLTYFGIAAFAIILAGCSNEDMPFENGKTNTGSFSIKATMLNGSTRVTAEAGEDNKYLLKWQEGDVIGVHNGQISSLTLSAGAGTGNATFSGDINGEGEMTTAVYPHNENHKYENGSWTIYMPETYNSDGAYTGNIHCPMIGTVTTDGDAAKSINFKHLCAAIRFEVNNLPAEASMVRLTTPGKTITGNFTVSTDGEASQINVTDGDSNNSVAISFSNREAAASEQSTVFFFPVPVGEYTSFKFEILGANDAVLNTYEKTGTFNLKRADMGLYPVISVGSEVEDLKNACKNGGTFNLMKDLTIEELTIEKDLVLNLGSYTLKSKQIKVTSGTLTIEGEENGVIDATEYTTDSSKTPGLIRVDGENAKVIVKSGKILTKYGTCIYQKQGDVEISGGTLESAYFAVSNNNAQSTAGANITISGGNIVSSEDWAIYIAKQSTVKISEDATITGKQGCVGINEGKVEVTGGTFSSECVDNTSVKSDGTNNLYGGIFAVAACYGSVELSVSAGTFNGKNAIVTSYQTPTSPKTRTIKVTGGTWEDPEVLNFADDNANITVKMAADKEIKKAITVNKGTSTVDFNGQTLSNKTDLGTGNTPDTHAFLISGQGTQVTFSDSGENGGITIDANASDKDGYRQAMIISENAKVIINGGKYYNTQKVNAQLDLIQVGLKKDSNDQANLEVNGGHFESGCYSTYNNKTPRYWVLNIKNECKNCKISVKGGEFINWNPANPDMDDKEPYLADGYEVKASGKDNVDITKTYCEAVSEETADQKTKISYTVSQKSTSEN